MATTDPFTNKGDASLVPPDDQIEISGRNTGQDETFERNLRLMIKLNAERAALSKKISAERKRMKKIDAIDLGLLDATIKLMELTPAEQRTHFEVAHRYARVAGFPIGTQLDLLGHADDTEIAKRDWHARGRSDALRLKPASVPKTCPPEFHQDYLEGHESTKWWSGDDEEAA